jgi:uncharacterized protein
VSHEWVAFPAGIVIATLATMVGLGGGVLWVPFLVLVAGMEPATAVLTSMVIQIAGMASGGITALTERKTGLAFAAMIAGAATPGVAFGVWLQRLIRPDALMFLVGAVCLAIGLLFVSAREDYGVTPIREPSRRALVPYLWLPPVFSVVTGLLSIGMGDFLVPVLRNRLGMRMDAAIGTCLCAMAMNAAVASALHLWVGESFSVATACWGVLGALIGGQIGPRIAKRVPDRTLKDIFIYSLSLIGIHILFNA